MSQFDSANNPLQPHDVSEYNRPLTHDELTSFVAKFCLLAPEQDTASTTLLHERGTVYMKKERGHFKERFAELSNSEILFWRSQRDYEAGHDPLWRYPLDIAFNLHRIGTTTVTVKHQHQQQHFWQFNLQALHPGSPSAEQTAGHGGDTVQGHVFAIVPNDRTRQELVLCIPDEDAHALWMQCLDLYEIISFSTLQFSAPLSHRERLEHAVVDEFALFREQSRVHGDASFNRVMMSDWARLTSSPRAHSDGWHHHHHHHRRHHHHHHCCTTTTTITAIHMYT